MIFYEFSARTSKRFSIELPESLRTQERISYRSLIGLLLQDNLDLTGEYSIKQKIPGRRSKNLTSDFYFSPKETLELEISLHNQSDLYNQTKRYMNAKNKYDFLKDQSDLRPEPDLVLLYADPLALERDREHVNKLDFTTEHDKFLTVFKRLDIQPYFLAEPATLRSLTRALDNWTLCVHISCHGYFKGDEFVLAFEDSKHIGLLQEITMTRLAEILRAHDNCFNLVVLSACHSEAAAKVFLDAGANWVISIDKNWKILDEIAIQFSEFFYEQLLLGNTIMSSFDTARERLREIEHTFEICCCSHKHLPNCKWKLQRHSCSEHLPRCQCANRFRGNLHKIDCDWAKKFIECYHSQRKPNSEELERGEWAICCCLKNIVHSESQKFKINYKENSNSTLRVKKAKIQELSPNLLLKPDYKIIGRNLDMVKILRNFNDKRLLNVYGETGVGVSTTVKGAIFYAQERDIFKDKVVYLDLKDTVHTHSVKRKLAEELGVFSSMHKIISTLKKMDCILIFDNASLVIDQNEDFFLEKIKKIQGKTHFARICIVTQNPLKISNTYLIKQLSVKQRFEILEAALLESKYPKASIEENKLELTTMIKDFNLTPNRLLSIIVPKLIDGFSIPEIKISLVRPISAGRDEIDERIYRSIISLESRREEQLLFLNLISLFPFGIPKVCLELFCSNQFGLNCNTCLQVLDEETDFSDWFTEEISDTLRLSTQVQTVVFRQSYTERNALAALKFLTSLSRVIMRKLSREPPYVFCRALKSLTYFSPLIPSSLWAQSFEVPIKHILRTLGGRRVTYVLEIYERMKKNFFKFIEVNYLNILFKNFLSSEVCEAVFELSECLICISLMRDQTEQASIVLESTYKSLKTHQVNAGITLKHSVSQDSISEIPRVSDAYFKLKLTDASLEYELKNRLSLALKVAGSVYDTFSRYNNNPCKAESALLQGLILAKKRDASEEEIIQKLTEAKSLFETNADQVGCARALFGVVEFYKENAPHKLSLKLAKELTNKIMVFRNTGLTSLELRCQETCADIFMMYCGSGDEMEEDDNPKELATKSERLLSEALYTARILGDTKLANQLNSKLQGLIDNDRF